MYVWLYSGMSFLAAQKYNLQFLEPFKIHYPYLPDLPVET